jgi:hypothetical protein
MLRGASPLPFCAAEVEGVEVEDAAGQVAGVLPQGQVVVSLIAFKSEKLLSLLLYRQK